LGHKQAAIFGDKFKWKRDYTDETAKRRLQNIVYPIAELAGLEIAPPDGKKKLLCPHTLHAVQMIYRQHSRIWKFPYEKKHDHITITIRESWRNKHRNSNRAEWEKFKVWAEERGEKVVVLEDQEENPISIKDRWDLYQCKMNLMVNNGPALMLILSDAPYIIMGYPGNAHDVYLLSVHHWLWRNAQYPWANKNQRLVWKKDTFEAISRCYLAIEAGGVSKERPAG